jgi:hypothetical protein
LRAGGSANSSSTTQSKPPPCGVCPAAPACRSASESLSPAVSRLEA